MLFRKPKQVFCFVSSVAAAFRPRVLCFKQIRAQNDDFYTPKNEVSALYLLCSLRDAKTREYVPLIG